jgi:RNA polymerase sigma-70 factor (ECF subfamily)
MWRDGGRRYSPATSGAAMLRAMQALDSAAADSPEALVARRIAGAAPGAARDAEAELYRLLAPRARRYGMRHLRDGAAAADLMQHVMALTIEQLRSGALREPERVASFVLGACRMTVIEQRRVERRRGELLARYADDLAIADIHVAPRLDHRRVADCLDRLPERDRAVLVMTFYDDAPADAIAGEMGLSPGNVRVIRHRGIDRLRRCVDGGARAAS